MPVFKRWEKNHQQGLAEAYMVVILLRSSKI